MNPLDVWGRGSDTVELFTECLAAMAEDPATGAVVLAVDLAEEYDGDESYPVVMENLLPRTDKPFAVLTNLTSAISPAFAERLRAQGIPVLEGTASGLRALGHLMAEPPRPRPDVVIDAERQARWAARLTAGTPRDDEWASLLGDYGIAVTPGESVTTPEAAVEAAERLGYPVVLKSDAPERAPQDRGGRRTPRAGGRRGRGLGVRRSRGAARARRSWCSTRRPASRWPSASWPTRCSGRW